MEKKKTSSNKLSQKYKSILVCQTWVGGKKYIMINSQTASQFWKSHYNFNYVWSKFLFKSFVHLSLKRCVRTIAEKAGGRNHQEAFRRMFINISPVF